MLISIFLSSMLTIFFRMDTPYTICHKEKWDNSLMYVGSETLDVTSTFASKGALDRDFTEVGP